MKSKAKSVPTMAGFGAALKDMVNDDLKAGKAPDRSVCEYWTPEFEKLYFKLHLVAKAAHDPRARNHRSDAVGFAEFALDSCLRLVERKKRLKKGGDA